MKNWRAHLSSSSVSLSVAFAAACGIGIIFLDITDAMFGILLAGAALFVAAIDIDRFEIPDSGNLLIMVFGLAWTFEASGLNAQAFAEALLRSMAAAATLFVVRWLYSTVRGFHGLGLGDVKLAAAGAPWLSWSYCAMALLIAAVAAIVVTVGRSALTRQRLHAQTPIPFGAFLAPAIWIAWFAQVSEIV